MASLDLKKVTAALGAGAHVVGGAVRDRLLGRRTDDLDVVVAVDPAAAAGRLAKALKGRAFALHAELGILRVVWEGGHIDVARLQGKTLEDDIDRRDFTVNALAVPLAAWGTPAWKKSVIDRHDGLADLKKRRIVPLSPKVFKEDPLRLLRAYRLCAELDFTVPAETARAVNRDRRLAARPASERLREEMLRLFSTPRAHPALVAMEKAGLLDVIFPPAAALRRTAPRYYGKGGVLKHTLDSVRFFEEIEAGLADWFPKEHRKIRADLAVAISGYPRSAHCKWGLLLHDIGKPKTAKMIKGRLRFFEHEHVGADMVASVAGKFRWSTEETNRYSRWVRHHMRPGNLATHDELTDKAFRRFFRDLEDDAISMLLVSLADHLTYLSPAQRRRRSSSHEKITIEMIRRFYRQPSSARPERLLTGLDVMSAFSLQPSPLIGKLLGAAAEAQIDGQIKTKAEALRHLKALLPKLQAQEGKK